MIEPTIGRVVWYWPDINDRVAKTVEQPLSAQIAAINDDGTLNLGILDAAGNPYSKQRVPLIQPEDERPEVGGFAEWMPYQKGQAAKVEELTQMAETVVDPLKPDYADESVKDDTAA